jgi:ADP-ribose pyrophosphatase
VRIPASSGSNLPVPVLPPLPAIRVRIARDRSAGALASGGFLNVSRFDLVVSYPDGTESDSFQYDVAQRRALDAAVIVAHFASGGVRHVYLRSAVRPPCAIRGLEPVHEGGLWEVPAGLVEPDEDPAAAAARELGEELGFLADAAAMRPLGAWTLPVPGMIAERNLYFCVEVDPTQRATPTEDGSALERDAAICAIPVAEALDHCRSGAIRDAKTELALRRLVDALGVAHEVDALGVAHEVDALGVARKADALGVARKADALGVARKADAISSESP